MIPTPMPAARRLAAIVLLAGSLLLLLLVFALPAAMAYENDGNGNKVQRADKTPIDQTAPGSEPGVESALTEAQRQLAEHGQPVAQVDAAGTKPTLVKADKSTDTPSDRTGDSAVAASLLAPPLGPKQDNVLLGPDGANNDDDKGDKDDDAKPPVVLQSDLAQANAKIEERKDKLAPTYDQRDQTVQTATANLEQAQANHAPSTLPLTGDGTPSPEEVAAAQLAAAQTRARAWYAERNGQDGQQTALQIIQEARDAGGEAARVIDAEQRAAEFLRAEYRQEARFGDTAEAARIQQELKDDYDPTNTSTKLWAALDAHGNVIPKTIEAAEKMLAAYAKAEQTAAALHPKDVAQDLAGWVPAEERLFAYQTARDDAQTAMRDTAWVANQVNKPGRAKVVDLPTATALFQRGQLPGWTEVHVNVNANLGQPGFPGEGQPAAVPGYPTENRVDGTKTSQAVIALLPVGRTLAVAPAPFGELAGNVQTSDQGKLVLAAPNGPSRYDAQVNYSFDPKAAPAVNEFPQWIEGYLGKDMEYLRGRVDKVRVPLKAIDAQIDARQAELTKLQADQARLANLGEGDRIHASEIAALQSELQRLEIQRTPLEAQLSALAGQAEAIQLENTFRQRGGELARVLPQLEAGKAQIFIPQTGQYVPAAGSATPVGKARQEYEHGVPDGIKAAKARRQLWRQLEAAAAALTPEVLAEAAKTLPPVDPADVNKLGLREAVDRHNAALALVAAYDAAVRALPTGGR